jgi:hypothetical protein
MMAALEGRVACWGERMTCRLVPQEDDGLQS